MRKFYLTTAREMNVNNRNSVKKRLQFLLAPLLFFVAIAFTTNLTAQTAAQYSFSASAGGYTEISGDPILIDNGNSDDGFANGFPIGFDFTFGGVTYNEFNVSTNGWITLGNNGDNNITNSGLTNNFATIPKTPLIAALWDDNEVSDIGRDVTFKSAGGVLTIQFTNIQWRYLASIPEAAINFQIKLYETTGAIEFVYDPIDGGVLNTPSASIGIATASGVYLSVNGTGTAPTASSTTSTNNLSTLPARGQTYTFNPPPPCTGTPAPGRTFASVNSVCASSGATVNLSFETFALGTTFQWEQSIDGGGSWSNVPGLGTNSTYVATPTATTQYRCRVTCTSSGASGFSTPTTVLYDNTCIVMPVNGDITTCSATFYDAGGPLSNYGASEVRQLTIDPSTSGANVKVVFNSFNTESRYDGLMIYNGRGVNPANLISSGLPVGIDPTTAPAGSFHGTTSPGTITSTDPTGSLTFVFRSDNIIQSTGWNATVSCILPCDATPTPGATLATSAFVCNGFSTTLSLTNNNFAGVTYQWQSSVDNASWSDIAGATSATFTATPTSNVFFRCKVTCTAAPAVPGFSTSIQIETSACDEVLMPSDGSLLPINTCSALFTDGGGTRADYINNSNGTVTFRPATAGTKIRATFTSFSTENNFDGLMIYNGNSTGSPLLSSGLPAGFNATTAPAGSYYGTLSPGVVSSTAADGSLTFVFKSDGTQVSSGWVATISCYVDNSCTGTPNPGATLASNTTVCYGGTTTLSTANTINATNIQYQWQSSPNGLAWSDITGATSTTYVVSSLTASTYYRATVRCTSAGGGVTSSTQIQVIVDQTCINMPTSATLATCNASFYDNGGLSANYTENQNRTFTITPTSAGSVNGPFSRVVFSTFTLDPSDTLKVYDGNSIAAPLLGAYTTNPGTITSSNTTNGGLTFVFKSNATLNAAGWVGTISCYTPPTCNTAPPLGAVLASIDTVCSGGSTNLSLSNAATLPGGLSYQWKSSSDGITYNNIAGASSIPTYSPTNLTATTWYQCVVTCSGFGTTTFTSVKVLVTPTPILTVSSATNVCGSGTVLLTASSSVAGAVIRWYSNAAGTTLVGTGSTYTTPVISTNTTYYVKAVFGDCESALSSIVAIINPFPSNIVINPQADTICVSPNTDSLRTSGGLFSDGSQAQITWSPVTYLFRDAAATIPYTLGTNAPTVYIKSTAPNGTIIDYIATAGTTCTKLDTSRITYRDITPSVTIAVTRPTGALCPSDTITFRATPVNGGNVTYPASFKFFINDVAVTTNYNTSDTIRFPGSLTTRTLNNGDVVKCVMLVNPLIINCATSNQFVSNSVAMTINTVKRDSVLLSTPSTSICTGTSVTFTATPQAFPGTAPEYEFLINGTIVRARSSVTTYTTSALTNGQVVTVRMYSNEPCVTPTPAVSLPITMTVTPFTAISVVLNSSVGTTSCVGTNVTYSALPSTYTPTSTYQFFVNNISVQGPNTDSTYAYIPVNGDQIKVVFNSNFSACLTGNPATSNIITMTVSSSTVASVTLTPTTAICSGVSKTFTANPTGGGSAPLYQFFVDGVSQQGPSTTATYSRTATANYNIEVRMTPDGCGLPNPATATLTQVVNPTPQGSLSANTICTGGTGQLTFTATSGTGPYTLVVNGVTYNSITSGTPFNASVNPTSTTVYTLTSVTDANGCNRATGFTNASATITVNTPPVVTITNNSSGATVLTCTQTQILLAASPSGAGFNVLWSNGSTNATQIITTPATYSVTVTQISTSCSTTSSNVVITQNANEPTGTGLLGTYFIPSGGASCRNFASIKNAIDTLNKFGISGNVTINVAAGYTETLTRRLDLGSTLLSANTALGRTINFVKSGAGANPKITAHTGVYTNPGSTTIDGMWSLSGVDNVTIDGIDLLDGNTLSPTTMMEYGYGLFKGYATKSATGPNATTTINVTDTIGLRVGSTVWVISGNGSFTVGTTITAIPTATSFTVSAAPAALTSNTVIGYSVPNDGAQNNTIKNCVVTLNKANNVNGVIPVLTGSVGIASYNSTSAVANTALTPTAKEGGNSRNKFYTNTISNCSVGIGLSGYTGTNAGRDTLNDVGGNSLTTGNTITNFGGAGLVNEVNGIRLRGQFDVNASYNTINNNNGGTANPAGAAVRGIYGESGISADTTIITFNNITINNGSGQNAIGIDNLIGNGILNGNGVNISNNTITGTNNSQTTGNFYAINNTSAVANLNISNNVIQNVSMNGAGEWRGVYNGSGCTNVTMNGNTIQNNTLGNTGNSLTTYNVYSAITALTSITANISGNQILNNTISRNALASALQIYMIGFAGTTGCNVSMNNNTITNNVINNQGTGTLDFSGINLGGASRYTLDNNTVSNFGINVNAATSAVLKVNGIKSEASSLLDSLVNNTLTQLYIKGTSTSTGLNEIRGIGTNSGVGSRYYFNNNINNLYSKADYSTVITGIRNQAGLTVKILKNKIYGLYPGQSATVGSTAKGINIVSLSLNSSANIYNNFISIDLSTGAPAGASGTALNNLDGIRGIELASTIINASTINVYNNSIRLAGTGTTNFGSSGIYQANNASSTIGFLNLKGNIISNECTRQGTGLIAAFRRNVVALNNYSTASNYNSFYAGTDTTVGKLFLVDGTTNFNGTITGLRTRLGAESGSISALPTFVAPSTGDLHITPCAGSNSSFENAVIGAPLFATDYDGDTRLDPSDIGADEISSGAGKVNADASVCSGSNGATLTLTGQVGVTSITRWEQSIDGGTNWTIIANTTTTYTYSNLTTSTLFRAIVNTASCSNASSGAATIQVNSAPSITTQPSIVAQSTCLNVAFSTPTVSVVTSASTPTYQWFSNATNSNSGGTPIASTNNASYTLPNNLAGTTYYYCIVTSGVCPSTSNVSAAMTVNSLPTITLTDNVADSVCFSSSSQNSVLEFTGTTNGANQYNITWNASPINSFAAVSLATLPTSPITIVVPASATANSTYTGNISVRNSTTGCSSASTTPFTIKVKSLVNANNPPLTAQTTCLNSAFTTTSLSVSSSSPSPTYQWFSNTTNSNVGGTNLGSANGAQTTTYSPQSNVVSTLYYYAVITSNGCSATTNPSGLWSVTTGPTSGALSGTYFIPTTVLNDCKVFGTIAAAVTYLNTNGISQSVIFKIAAGYTETLSSTLALGSASLNNTTSTKTIRFEKNGAGANPLITAYTGGTGLSSSGTPDGIWSLRGVDYVTIDGIDIRENASNTTAASQMEYGYGLFKLSATDGAQFDTIKNCTITLNKNNTTLSSSNFFNGATGIAMTNATAVAPNTLLTPTNVTGANSNNTFISNTISNVNVGIGLIGFAANDQASFADVNNLVGDTITSSKGNSITNLGGGTTANNTEVSTGVLLKNQLNALVGFNTITGADHAEDQYGVRSDNTTGTGSIVIKQNNISITGAGDRKYAGIENNTGGGASSVINITNNTLNVKIPNGVTTTVAASVTGIRNGSTLTPATINISNNSFKNSTIAGAGRWIGIYNTTNTNSATTGIITMNNNNISENNILATGSFNGLQTDASIYGTQTISGDTITNNSKTISGVAELSWLSQKPSSIGNCGTLNIQNNSIQNNDVFVASSNASAVNVYGVYSGGTKTGAVLSLSANTIRKLSLRDINSNNIGKLWGLFTNSNLAVNPTETIADNKISNLFISAAAGSSATHTITGLQLGNVISNTTVRNVFQNRIDSFYVRNNNDATAYNSTVTGIYIPVGTGITSMYTNKVAHLVPFGAAGIARGFWLGTSPNSSTPVSIYNNMIELDMTQAFDGASATSLNNVDAIRGIDITGGVAGTPYNISFNTIRIGGTGGSSFGTTVVDMNINNPTYTFRNNVFVNKATPGASGIVAILRASANQLTANTKYSSSSSNNAYFAGTVASSNYLYYDGSNNFQTLSSLQPTREANSIENTDPLFARSADNQDSLHMNGTSNCAFNGTGIDVSGISTDIDGTPRLSPPDMGADEYNTTGGGIGQWAGINTNWNDGVNWCGAVPTANTDVTIPNGRSNYPIISSSNPVANTKNLTIANAASVTISSGGKLNIYGNISSPGTGRLNATLGTIEMVGSSAQTIPANLFASDNLRNLVINNSSVTLAGQLNLLNKLSFTGSSRTFATGSFLTLKSTDTLTASVADITNGGNSTGNTITGNVSVERFISNVKNSTPTLKAWRLLSMPTTHNLQTIKQSWQENGDSTTVFNPNPGFGAQIITRLGGTNAAARALGFDSYNANGGSLKTFNIGTQVWEEVSTTNAAFDAQKPYVLFIRGSRAKTLFTDVPDVTVMRERGALNLGDFTISNLPTAANKFASIVNPYASAIRLPATRNGFKPSYYLYDPRIGVNGGWITVLEDGTSAYNGGSYTNGNFNIQSAQGFFMETNAANPTMTIKETDKVDGSSSVQRENRNQKKFYTRLYKVQNGSADLYDGVLNRFDESYNNEVDDYDATKFTNTTENFAIAKNDKLISIESRKALTENDTIFYKMNQMRVANYRFEFLPENIESFNLQAYLEDKYTNTLTPVSLTERTVFDFAIGTNVGAYASDRFRIIFKQLRPLPVTFVDVKAIKQKEQVNVNWKVENEVNIREYAVEKSANGVNFVKIGTVQASGIADYAHVDESPFAGINFYRIRSVGVAGEVGYSKIVKVSYEAEPMISIFPNPIKSDRKATISFKNINAGRYTLKLTNNLGQVLMRKAIQHDGVTTQYDFTLSKSVLNGSYTLEIIGQDNKKTSLKILF
jgi:hypothetical protein